MVWVVALAVVFMGLIAIYAITMLYAAVEYISKWHLKVMRELRSDCDCPTEPTEITARIVEDPDPADFWKDGKSSDESNN